MGVYASLNCFNAGELSPRMIGRNDVSQYSKGCRILKNFMVTPYGSVERRPGTEYIANTKYSDMVSRLVRFVYSSEVGYVCEFGDKYIRFFRDGIPVLNSSGSVHEVETPYLSEEVSRLQFIQSADVMTIIHPSHCVMELKRVSENEFNLIEKAYEYPPVLDPNIDDEHTIKPSGLSGSIELTASKDTFTSGNVGGYYQLVHTRKNNEISKDFTSDGTSDSIEVFGYWTFTTHGTWTGNVTIQRSFDGGNSWNDFRTYSSANDSNTSTSGEEENKDVLYRISMRDYSQSSSGTLKKCRCLLVNPDFQITGVVKITAVTDSKTAAGQVISKLGDITETSEWNEGAWSDRRGYPSAIAYYEERMVLGGTKSNPNRIWASKTNDWDNFLVGSKDDDGIDLTIASDTVNTISWFCQHDALIIGTLDSEWTLSASDSSKALTPSNFQLRRQSVYGSTFNSAQMVGDTVLFVQRGGKKVREFVFQWEKNGYVCPDMTVLADHISRGGIREIALQRLPDSILWCVLEDGTAAALTYERDQEVVGWHRHETEGKILSCCVIPSGAEDCVYFVVKRDSQIFIEMLHGRKFDRTADSFFVDCGKKVTGSKLTSVIGLGYLEGKTVQVFADGAVHRELTVESGKIDLDYEVSEVTVGLGYESVLSPMPIEVELQNGQSVLRKKCIGSIRLRSYSSVGGEIRCGSDGWQKVFSRDVLMDRLDSGIEAKDDVVVLNMLSGSDYTPVIEVRQRDPLPLNVSSMVVVYDVNER